MGAFHQMTSFIDLIGCIMQRYGLQVLFELIMLKEALILCCVAKIYSE